jgi:hypothetical protein
LHVGWLIDTALDDPGPIERLRGLFACPGLVTVGWMPCECPEAQAENLGHLWVRCHAAEGCSSVWYRPAHKEDRLLK